MVCIFNTMHAWTYYAGRIVFPEPLPQPAGAEYRELILELISSSAFIAGRPDDPTPRFRAGPAASPVQRRDYTATVGKNAAARGFFQPWWPLYDDWIGELKNAKPAGDAEPPGEIARMSLHVEERGGEPTIAISDLRILLRPLEERWDPAVTKLTPPDRVEEVRRLVERVPLQFRLFEGPHPIPRARSLTQQLWSSVPSNR
jgi:hypothetical protein